MYDSAMPRSPRPEFPAPVLITDTAALEALCARLRTEAVVTVDTEFMRERTYWPELCVVQLASDTEVHLALLDMNLPKLTGLETLQLVRQMHAMLPGILVTADNSQSLMREAQRSSVYSVLPKPVRKEMVLGTVARALRKHYGCA